VDTKPVTQTTVAAVCPNCNNRHEIPLEKGKNGKPFFMACAKCKTDFAVRFVQVMSYQAQVAGFR
jgi:ssDNA-binding Zn-finger/Zn-ribbon topoisomerase 1